MVLNYAIILWYTAKSFIIDVDDVKRNIFINGILLVDIFQFIKLTYLSINKFEDFIFYVTTIRKLLENLGNGGGFASYCFR